MVTLPQTILRHQLGYRTVTIGASLYLGLSSLMGCSTVISAKPPSPLPAADAQDSPKTKESPNSSIEVVPQAAPSDETIKSQTSIEAATLETLTLYDLEDWQGTPYGQVRDRLMDRGWIPHTFAMTTGSESDFRDSRVQEMEGLNYLEVKTCSGTGQGFCQFEFVYQNRTAEHAPVLAVTTAAASPGDTDYPDPIFWDFHLDERSDLTYVERSFDQPLFAELQQQSFCLGVGQCEPRQYMLKDALLIASSGGFGTAKMALIPDAPVSKEEAIAYAKILDAGNVIDFDTVHLDHELNTEQYYEAGVPQDTVAERGGITAVSLKLTPNGSVSEISFSVIVL